MSDPRGGDEPARRPEPTIRLDADPAADPASGPGPDDAELIEAEPRPVPMVLRRLGAAAPTRTARVVLVAAVAIALLAGLGIGRGTGDRVRIEGTYLGTAVAERVSVLSFVRSMDFGALLTVQDFSAAGIAALGGTYSTGSASSLPDLCGTSGGPEVADPPSLPADPGIPIPEIPPNRVPDETAEQLPTGPGVVYQVDDTTANAVSFTLPGATLTERLSRLNSELEAAAQLRGLVQLVEDCPSEGDSEAAVRQDVPGVGEEAVAIEVTETNPSNGTVRPTTIILARVGSVVLEFAVTGSELTDDDRLGRAITVAMLGVAAYLGG